MRHHTYQSGLVGLAAGMAFCCSLAHAQPATQSAPQGPFKLTLADVNVCLDTLGGVQKEAPAAGAELATVRKVLETAKSTAGQPVKDAPIPWTFANNLAAGPYLQNVTSNSVLIRWTAIQSDTTVRYGTGGKLTSTATAVRLPAPRRMHEALLTGLAAGARYTYSIRMGDRDVTGTFRTAPAGDEPFTFAVWGDSQMDTPERTTQPTIAAQMAKQSVDLAISIGDIVDLNVTDSDFYQEFFLPAAGLLPNVPFFAAVGNHEPLGDPDLARYRRWIRHPGPDKTYYASTYANCRFIVLDSNDPALANGPQLEWFKQELASDACKKARFCFVALHHSPYCWDWDGGDKRVRQTIVPLAEANNVDAIFSGHYHCYDRGIRTVNDHKTCYIVTGGGGGMFTQPPRFGPGKNEYDFMTKHEWKRHFVTVKVDTGGLSFRAIDEKGEVFDEFAVGGTAPAASAPAAPAGAQAGTDKPAVPSALALGADETRICTIPAADRTAALEAIRQCRKALPAEQSEASYRLELLAAALDEARDGSREGSWSGQVVHTGHGIPLMKLNEKFHYRFKPSDNADAATKTLLDPANATSVKGAYEVKGEDIIRGSAFGAGLSGGWRWVLVDSIKPK